ncbi:MAG TPA: hypothetical protein DCS09_03885 [Porphyromonadaceae bacterium]|nr:hypothetical protein [Porphyromonadaceae bacterium]
MSDGYQARTIKSAGIYLAPEMVELFALNPEAHYIWLYAMMMANTGWTFRKKFVKDRYIGCGEWKWKAAIRFLISVGLLEIVVTRNKKGKINGREYIFRDLANRLEIVSFDDDDDEPKTPSKTRKPAKINHLTEGQFSPCVDKTDPLCTSSREKAVHTQKPTILEAEMDQDQIEQHRARFMKHFTGKNTFQTFSDNKESKVNLAKVFHNDMSRLDDVNYYGGGIFLTINETDGKGRKRDNIKRVRAIFVDLDGSPLEPVLEYDPHLVVETSPGKYHAYWFVKDFPLEAFSPTQKTLAEMFEGDPVVNDISRVMRIPGYWHQKGEPFMSRIVLESYYEPLSYAEVVQKFPPKPVKQWSRPKEQEYDENSDYKGQYGTDKGNRNHGLARFIGGMVKRRKDFGHMHNEAYRWGKGCNPPLSDNEIESVLRSVGRYAA